MIEVADRCWKQPTRLAAAVLDWAGTTVDFGSRAPVLAIQAALEQAGVPVSELEVRRAMGRAKRDHLRDLLSLPDVATRWRSVHGGEPVEADVDSIYQQFLVLQSECVVRCSALIPGCAEAVAECRRLGLRIGSSTGYTRALLADVAGRAHREGYKPDVMLSADDVPEGRPAPWLCIENARRLGVYPMSAVVKVDDTPVGVAAGRNAGAWSVGVVETGNEVGLSREQLDSLSGAERASRLEAARERLTAAGAHFLIESITELPIVVVRINERMAGGDAP